MHGMQGMGRYDVAKIGRCLLIVCGAAALVVGNARPAAAQTNLALNKPARQSSTSAWSTANDAQGAVNGVKNGSFGFHTDIENQPWWQVDLQQVYPLGEIHVYNRMEEAARAASLLILLSNDGSTWQQVYSQGGTVFGGVTDGKPLKVNLSGRQARFVRLQLAARQYFHLDEVEVYAGSSGTGTTQPVSGSFHAIWSTDLGLYLGLVQSGNQVRGYYWWEGNWYSLLTGTVNGRVLSGRWDAQVADGTFTFTLTPDGRGFDAVATGLYGWVEFSFKGGLYLNWN